MSPRAEAQHLSAREHGLQRSQVDGNAVDVVERLEEAGFQAFLVGGCVRDLLLGKAPKDFDVATSATPEQVKRVFRRARLVGRRFRIAHVRYGRHIIEVSTFRKGLADDEDERDHADSGLILRDNVWGTLDEDAFRRDFTINALYYDPHTEEIIDFVGGLQDLERRRLRFIGDADVRLREDPVRLLRAVRFHAKLGFALDPEIEAAIPELAEHLREIPPARLFDEICKLFVSGKSLEGWNYLSPTRLRWALFPCAPPDDPLIALAMNNTDRRIAEDKPVTPGFLFAVVMWRDYEARRNEYLTDHKPAEARAIAAGETLAQEQLIIAIPRRFSQFVRDVWGLQHRLEERRPRTVASLVEHERFRAAYDFLVLRGEAGDGVEEAGDWWTRYQELGDEGRQAMVDALRGDSGSEKSGKRRKRRRRKRSPGGATGATGGASDQQG
ncbi:MAG: polynucleotide adenylyltransferase PcnB [Pseudomonadales bacterium]